MDCGKGVKSLLGIFGRGKKAELLLCALILALIAFCWLSYGERSDGVFNFSASGTDIESRMAKTLSAIKGAGRVEVMITHDAASPNAEYELWSSGSQISSASQPIKGAIIVAEGAKDIAVSLELLKAAQTLLDVPASKVEVFEMTVQ